MAGFWGLITKSIGKFIGDIVDFKPVILEVLKTGKGYVDKEFMVKTSTGFKHFMKTAVPIRDENGRITAVVDTFREIKRGGIWSIRWWGPGPIYLC